MTVLDAGVLIGLIDSDDRHHSDARRAVGALVRERAELLVSSVTFSEVFVGSFKTEPLGARRARRLIGDYVAPTVIPFTETDAMDVALLRARTRLSMTDAAVVATARSHGAERILTADADFNGVPGAIQLGDFVKQLEG